jgi:hypothetical protein
MAFSWYGMPHSLNAHRDFARPWSLVHRPDGDTRLPVRTCLLGLGKLLASCPHSSETRDPPRRHDRVLHGEQGQDVAPPSMAPIGFLRNDSIFRRPLNQSP